ncbi:MAG: hypothetical protein LBT95_02070 [Treponema sp.]|jgi:hypothetical protein|nr:hypothetical protein [Treponema sp.]
MKQKKMKNRVVTARAWGLRYYSGKQVYGIPVILNDDIAIISFNKNKEKKIANEPDREDINLKAYIIRQETLKVDEEIERENVDTSAPIKRTDKRGLI